MTRRPVRGPSLGCLTPTAEDPPKSVPVAVSSGGRGIGDDGTGRTAGRRVMVGSNEHPNVAAYRRTADAFRAGDMDTLRSLVAEDVVWHVPGGHPMAGEIHGLDELVAWLGRLSGLGFTLREHDVLGSDEHVCALSYMGVRRPGLEVEIQVVSVFHFRDGKQVERWLYPEDMAAWDSLFSD